MGSRSDRQARLIKRRVLIVDDHPLVRRGLTATINHEADLTVCAAAATQRSGLEAIAAAHPDLIITDLSLAEGDGLELVKNVLSSGAAPPVLVLSVHDAHRYARRALQAGARGYVNKQAMNETLVLAIRRVLDGETFVSPEIN